MDFLLALMVGGIAGGGYVIYKKVIEPIGSIQEYFKKK